MTNEMKVNLLRELDKLHERHELSKTVGPDYFEPGLMEYLDKSDGSFDSTTGNIELFFEARGTRYEGRTERIENVKIGDVIKVTRDAQNPYNPNNFRLLTFRDRDVGNMPAELCNAIAPLFDEGALIFTGACVSYAEPLSKRNRHAKQAVMFVHLSCLLKSCADYTI